MHITWSETPTAGSKAMNDAIDGIGNGGPTSLGTYFSIFLPAGLFLIFLALPRQGWTKPEEPLPPGALWASIVIAGGGGVLMVPTAQNRHARVHSWPAIMNVASPLAQQSWILGHLAS